jgi:mannose-6-phosphate isomerase-like protein (cupin superfamily)
MARVGDVIEHPGTGEQIVFRQTARETGGMELVLEFRVRPGGFVAGAHVHPRQEERFDVLEGTVRFRVDGQERDAGPGQTVVVPAGVPHVWWNPGEAPVRLIVRFGPALRTEEFFEVFFGLAQDGKTDPQTGQAGLLQSAVMIWEFRREIRPASPPLAVQWALVPALAAIGRLLRYRPDYPYPYAAQSALA